MPDVRPTYRLLVLLAALAFLFAMHIRDGGKSQGSSSAYQPTKYEWYAAGMVNGERVESNSLRALRFDPYLSRCAHQHSVAMAKQGKIYHSTDYQLLHCHSHTQEIAENVGTAPDLNTIQRGLWHSKEHRANMLCNWCQRMGTGVAQDSSGYWYITQLFWTN